MRVLEIERQSLLLGATRNRMVLNRQGGVEQSLSLPAKLMLNTCQGAALVWDASNVILLNILRNVG
jgi:hypothetical protein